MSERRVLRDEPLGREGREQLAPENKRKTIREDKRYIRRKG
jgi:hypothetical protein